MSAMFCTQSSRSMQVVYRICRLRLTPAWRRAIAKRIPKIAANVIATNIQRIVIHAAKLASTRWGFCGTGRSAGLRSRFYPLGKSSPGPRNAIPAAGKRIRISTNPINGHATIGTFH